MPSKDKTQTNRDRKKQKKNNFDINGKYSSKYVRQKEEQINRQSNVSKDSSNEVNNNTKGDKVKRKKSKNK